MAKPYSLGMVVTRTPVRVSFAGGGTDLAEFYERDYGAVLSTTIQQYVYITVKPHSELFGEPIRLNYSETEQVSCVDEIRNDIARECLRLLDIEPPIYVSTIADIPAASGLGSSSAFAVGLLNALHTWRGERVSAGQLAQEAAYVEITVLKRPIGKQDHFAAAFGGLNFLRFQADGEVSVAPQRFAPRTLEALFGHLMMFWTGMSRDAHAVLAEQEQNTPAKMAELYSLREQAHELRTLLQQEFDARSFGAYLDRGWRVKRELASSISNSQIDDWYQQGIKAGAYGGKLCGAGGGGFLLFVVPSERQVRVRQALSNLPEVSLFYEPQGTRVLMPHVE